eukprot:2231082-Pleurochrysis_carterae.AAC.6
MKWRLLGPCALKCDLDVSPQNSQLFSIMRTYSERVLTLSVHSVHTDETIWLEHLQPSVLLGSRINRCMIAACVQSILIPTQKLLLLQGPFYGQL